MVSIEIIDMKPNIGSGDKGDTGLYGAGRVGKGNLRVECYGDVDELNSFIGLARAELGNRFQDIDSILFEIQNKLFTLGADLASPNASKIRLSKEDVEFVENTINELEKELTSLGKFILPGGTKASALLHVARTVCRRVERGIASLSKAENVGEFTIPFANRLSDLFFTLARVANKRLDTREVEWR